MEKTIKLSALRVSNQLDLKGIKSFLDLKSDTDGSFELFCADGSGRYIYYFDYGIIVFSDYSEEEIKAAVANVEKFQNKSEAWLRMDLEIVVQPGAALRFEARQLIIKQIDDRAQRIVMLNLGRSIALDHYLALSENLLMEMRDFTNGLESKGKLHINRKNMLKFIGRALNTQNDIAGNIYIFDASGQSWSNEQQDELNKSLMQHFDVRVRVTEIQYTLRIIEDTLKLFLQISNQRESNLLELVIILLILVELLNVFLPKLF